MAAELFRALYETLYMVFFSTLFSTVFGFGLAIALIVTGTHGLRPNPKVYAVLDVCVNLLRSFPFMILMIALIPFTRLMVGMAIGSTAAIVPLTRTLCSSNSFNSDLMGSSPCGERDLQHRISRLFLRGHRFAYTILQRGVRRPVRTFPDGSEQDSPAQPGPQRRKGREGDEDQLAPTHLAASRRHLEDAEPESPPPGDEQRDLAAAGVAQHMEHAAQKPEGGAPPDRFGARRGEPRKARHRALRPREETKEKARQPQDDPVRAPAMVPVSPGAPDQVFDRIGKRAAQKAEEGSRKRARQGPDEHEVQHAVPGPRHHMATFNEYYKFGF